MLVIVINYKTQVNKLRLEEITCDFALQIWLLSLLFNVIYINHHYLDLFKQRYSVAKIFIIHTDLGLPPLSQSDT